MTLAAAMVTLTIQALAFGQEATSYPVFNGGGVYVVGVPNHYEAVDRTIRDLERRSPQSYYVVVVKSSGSGPHATRDYLDRLYDVWQTEAKARGLKFDPERSVVVVAALDNRQVAVHPGSALRDRFGLKASTIDGEIVPRAFIPLARANDYPGALNALLTATDDFIAARGDKETRPANFGSSVSASEKTTATGTVTTTTLSRPPAARPSTSGRDVAAALLGSLAALAVLIAGLVWLAKRRARNNFNTRFKEYRSKAVAMMDRLDGLKARLRSLPTETPDFKEPMTGQTLNHFEQVQGDLSRLWDRWLEVMEVVDRAQKKSDEKLGEADHLISDSSVFDDVEAGARACGAAMDQLANAHDAARKAAEELAESRSRAAENVNRVGGAGLPTAPYQSDVDRLDALGGEAGGMLASDPLGAKSLLADALAAAEALRDRAGSVAARFDEGKQVQTSLEKLRSDVADQRRGGLRLDEEGGDPDHQAAQSELELVELQKALEAGDPAAAATHLEAARKLADEARGTLDAVVQARAFCLRDQSDRERETRRLREALAQYEAFESELKRDFAPASWQPAAGNMTQARALLETFDQKAQEAAAAASDSSQKYLLGSRLLGQIGREQQAVFRLMSAVGERLAGLKALREESRKAAADLVDLRRELERFFSQYDHVLGAQARESLKAATEADRRLGQESNEARPDWPAVRQAQIRAAEEYAIARSRAEADLKIYQALDSEYDQARRYAAQVQAFLAGHAEDRKAANQRYRIAEEVLNRVGDEGARVGNEWSRLLEQVRGARADLEQADRLAREDVRLARQAESEIADAARTIRQARAYFSMGVTLGTAGAESLLDQAQQLYHAQNYEQAIQAAGAAVQQVRQAHQQAAQQAYIRQLQVEADQRRSAAGMRGFGVGAAAGVASAMLDRAASDSGGRVDYAPPPTTTTEGGSESSSSSWSSESSESSW